MRKARYTALQPHAVHDSLRSTFGGSEPSASATACIQDSAPALLPTPPQTAPRPALNAAPTCAPLQQPCPAVLLTPHAALQHSATPHAVLAVLPQLRTALGRGSVGRIMDALRSARGGGAIAAPVAYGGREGGTDFSCQHHTPRSVLKETTHAKLYLWSLPARRGASWSRPSSSLGLAALASADTSARTRAPNGGPRPAPTPPPPPVSVPSCGCA
jgi:hypothetical protein